MNIRYNHSLKRFEAEFSSDFQGDLASVKDAKFKTTGAPSWVWWTDSVVCLNRLREKRPESGLTIAPDALEIYKPLAELEVKNQEVKKQLLEARKAAKKQKQKEEKSVSNWLPAGKEFLTREDLPPIPPIELTHLGGPRHQPDGRCNSCQDPTYLPLDLIDLCAWCEKELDTMF